MHIPNCCKFGIDEHGISSEEKCKRHCTILARKPVPHLGNIYVRILSFFTILLNLKIEKFLNTKLLVNRYVSLMKRSGDFFSIFKAWKTTSLYFAAKDCKLKRDTILISVVILLSAALENSLLYLTHITDMIQGCNLFHCANLFLTFLNFCFSQLRSAISKLILPV